MTVALVALGLLFRLAGLPVNGMMDLDGSVIQWGGEVVSLGLGRAFAHDYGLWAYAFFGASHALALEMPRFWWAPFKALMVGVELATLVLLLRLVPERGRQAVLWLYWLNPLFVLHGAWWGFFDGAHTLMAVAAAALLAGRGRGHQPAAWAGAGFVWFLGAQLKPQGLAYVLAPAGLLALVLALRRRPLPLLGLAGGCLAGVVVAEAALLATGGDALGLVRNVATASRGAYHLCGDCLGIWRAITAGLMAWLGQSGPPWTLRLPGAVLGALHVASFAAAVGAVAVFAWVAAAGGDNAGEGAEEDRLTAALRGAGALGALAFLGALFHRTGAAEAPVVLGRWSLAWALALLALLAVALVGLGAARPLARFLRRAGGRLAFRLGPPPAGGASVSDAHLVTAFAALVMPSLATMTHANYKYAGLVLLVPLVALAPRLRQAWLVVAAVDLYGYLAHYRLGRPAVLPDYFLDRATSEPLAGRIGAAAGEWPGLTAAHKLVSEALERAFPIDPMVPLLALVGFGAVLVLLRGLLALAVEEARQG